MSTLEIALNIARGLPPARGIRVVRPRLPCMDCLERCHRGLFKLRMREGCLCCNCTTGAVRVSRFLVAQRLFLLGGD